MEGTDAFLSTILSIVQSGVHSVANNCTETFGQDIANIFEAFKSYYFKRYSYGIVFRVFFQTKF